MFWSSCVVAFLKNRPRGAAALVQCSSGAFDTQGVAGALPAIPTKFQTKPHVLMETQPAPYSPTEPMAFSPQAPLCLPAANQPACDDRPVELAATLEKWFGLRFAIVDGSSGKLLVEQPSQPCADWETRAQLCRAVANGQRAEIVAEEDPFYVLAVPFHIGPDQAALSGDQPTCYVAVATMLSRPIESEADVQRAAPLVGDNVSQVVQWASQQPIWPLSIVQRVAQLAIERWLARQQTARLEREVDQLSEQISSTYEEISLIYRLIQNLKLNHGIEDLGRLALSWLDEVVSAEAFVFYVLSPDGATRVGTDQPLEPVFLTRGRADVNEADFMQLVESCHLDTHSPPFVANPPTTQQQPFASLGIRQLVLVPLAEGDNLFGWLAAINHAEGCEFGSVEANLLSTVASILGIHHGNSELYRQQAELLAGVIRALSSAIDAKDPYTCGHSDRVARIAVTIGREMGLDEETLKTVYLGGLLHDVGKIGIKDEVLRKPGRLTEEEFEHIKTHPEIGYRILVDLKKLGDVLPIVRHHHESWDGRGYPSGLGGHAIPFLARLVAVADAFDAMASDRPYRRGMDDDKLDTIFQKGSGNQWDPEIVAAMFRVRKTVGDIAREITADPVPELAGLTR